MLRLKAAVPPIIDLRPILKVFHPIIDLDFQQKTTYIKMQLSFFGVLGLL